jgi:hypothetical protein
MEKPGEAKVEELVAQSQANMEKHLAAGEAKAEELAAARTADGSRADWQRAADEVQTAEDMDLLLEMLCSVPGVFVNDQERRAAVDRIWSMDPPRRRLMARCLRVLVLRYGAAWADHAPLIMFTVGMGIHLVTAGYRTVQLRREWAAAPKAKAPEKPDGRAEQAA